MVQMVKIELFSNNQRIVETSWLRQITIEFFTVSDTNRDLLFTLSSIRPLNLVNTYTLHLPGWSAHLTNLTCPNMAGLILYKSSGAIFFLQESSNSLAEFLN